MAITKPDDGHPYTSEPEACPSSVFLILGHAPYRLFRKRILDIGLLDITQLQLRADCETAKHQPHYLMSETIPTVTFDNTYSKRRGIGFDMPQLPIR